MQEIERKFLLKKIAPYLLRQSWNSWELKHIEQIYLDEFSRIRFSNGSFELTTKSINHSDSILQRVEINTHLNISIETFNKLKDIFPYVIKDRRYVPFTHPSIKEIIIDCYEDMILLEIEFIDSNINLENIIPLNILECIDQEVTMDISYQNYYIALRGFNEKN